MCVAYAEVEFLDFIYLVCSLNLTSIVYPLVQHTLDTCIALQPIYTTWIITSVFSCRCIVLVTRKAILKLVRLNRLVTRLTSGLKYVKVTRLFKLKYVEILLRVTTKWVAKGICV